ncbi:MAG: hypothetical protein JXI33_04185 [Candidatus Aminicenantes bacterium]|nr:hypothetical protein [Candidatus Aminicenantes bacterium]
MKAGKLIFIIPFCLWLFVACRQKTETEIIADMVADMAVHAEKRDAEGLIVHLAGDYRDFENRDRDQTAALIEEYFSRYRGIVIHVLSSRIVLEDIRDASLELDVSLSSGAAQAFRKMVRFSGENYRFRCRLRKDDRWLIVKAEWEYVALEGLFPESVKILRELFPNL